MPSRGKADPIDEALLFSCQQCGSCCRGYGGTFLSQRDIQKITVFTKTDPASFVETYCRYSGGRPILAQQENGFCIFWNEVCTIHPVKPRMCREWPFIPGVLADPANWEIMAASCPGIQTNVPIDWVLTHIRNRQSR
jgi:Fe-S-cluster containining protein